MDPCFDCVFSFFRLLQLQCYHLALFHHYCFCYSLLCQSGFRLLLLQNGTKAILISHLTIYTDAISGKHFLNFLNRLCRTIYRRVMSRSIFQLVTPQIEFNSISNMGCQKIKVFRSLRYSSYIMCLSSTLRSLIQGEALIKGQAGIFLQI